VIFKAAAEAGAVVMTKDRDFIRLLDEQGPPPQVIWLRLGNYSNAALQDVLSTTLARAMEHLRDGEPWIEIRPSQ
jgi:predicted nuclease of predicted toxin-antitoxin system